MGLAAALGQGRGVEEKEGGRRKGRGGKRCVAVGSLLLTALTGKAACSRAAGGAARYSPPLARGAGGGTDVPARRFPRGAERQEKLSERRGGGGRADRVREGKEEEAGRARDGGVGGRPRRGRGRRQIRPQNKHGVPAWREGAGGKSRVRPGSRGGRRQLPPSLPTEASINNAGACLRGSPGPARGSRPCRSPPWRGLP